MVTLIYAVTRDKNVLAELEREVRSTDEVAEGEYLSYAVSVEDRHDGDEGAERFETDYTAFAFPECRAQGDLPKISCNHRLSAPHSY